MTACVSQRQESAVCADPPCAAQNVTEAIFEQFAVPPATHTWYWYVPPPLLPVLSVYAEPLLASVPPDQPEYQDARSLLGFLANFAPLGPRWVPPDSILREFIGESTFKY